LFFDFFFKRWFNGKYFFVFFIVYLDTFRTKEITKIYYVDLKQLVDKSTREFLINNKKILSSLYEDIPEDNKYAYFDELKRINY